MNHPVFTNPLTELAEYEEMVECLKKDQGPIHVSGSLDLNKYT